jgi:hypothetical protein
MGATRFFCHKCRAQDLDLLGEDAVERVHCNACLAAIVAALARRIDEIDPLARQLYIGRTNYPERRLLEHYREGRDHLAVLHWSPSWRECAQIEEQLIAEFRARGKVKLENEAEDSSGKWSGPWNCIYLSWEANKKSAGAPRLSAGELVEHLHWAQVQPDAGLWERGPQDLRVGGSISTLLHAAAEIEALDARRRSFRAEQAERRRVVVGRGASDGGRRGRSG